MRPWLWMPAGLAHRLSPIGIRVCANITPQQKLKWKSLNWRGLHFPTPLGLAGGVDKDATQIEAWSRLGAGFIEIGTVTPQPQVGHAGTTVARDAQHLAIWNRLGFPSAGVAEVARRLKGLGEGPRPPLFANIGKNKSTELNQAHLDYIACLRQLRGLVDVFVVNVSSPNTQGLRDLLKPTNLRSFLSPIVEENRRLNSDVKTPLLLKISPDLEAGELETILDTSGELEVDGWILTNSSAGLRQGLSFPAEGGVSGRPLSELSKRVLSQAVRHLGSARKDRLVVSVGGVMDSQDVLERLSMGADLIQVYSALIFSGPWFFRQVAKAYAH